MPARSITGRLSDKDAYNELPEDRKGIINIADWAAIILVTIPIFMPISIELGFDPLWFSMLMCVNLQTSFLTPPFGYALFYFAGVAPGGCNMMVIYRGILPFVLLQVIGLILIVVFPDRVTWLPNLFFGR